MAERERTKTGEYVETVTPEAVLDAVASHLDPTVTAREVGEAMGCSTDAARKKLTQLHADGKVERKTVGARAVVWWLTDEERTTTGVDPTDGFWSATPGSSSEPTDAAKTDEEHPPADPDRNRDYLKSFGKYAGTNVAETAESVSERFDRDLRARRERRTDGDR